MNLSCIYIPISVTLIQTGAFSGCDQLKDVYYQGAATNFGGITIQDTTISDTAKVTWHWDGY